MKSKSLRVLVVLGILLLAFVVFELFLTSHFDLQIQLSFYPGLSSDTPLQLRLQGKATQETITLFPTQKTVLLKGLNIENYTLTVSLDTMTVYSRELSFENSFSFLRQREEIAVDIEEISTVTYIEYSIEDPLLRIKWQVKNLKDFIPAQFEVTVQDSKQIVNVNYLEIDVRNGLKTSNDTLELSIAPLSREGKRIHEFQTVLPVRLANLKLNLPPQLDSFETSLRVSGQILQMDPYTNVVVFPYLLTGNPIPVEILYYQQPILNLPLTPEQLNQTVSLPLMPAATVTQMEFFSDRIRLHVGLENPEGSTEFFRSAFKYFWVQADMAILSSPDTVSKTVEATTASWIDIAATSTALDVFLIPQFDYGIQGRATKFTKPAKPAFQVMLTERKSDQIMNADIFSISPAALKGRYKVDRQDWVTIPIFIHQYSASIPMSFDQIHSLEISLEDEFAQSGEYKKWVDPSIPQTTFFRKVQIEAGILTAEWQPLTVYQQLIATVTDGYNKVTLTPETNSLQVDLSKTALYYPLKIILKGKLGRNNGADFVEELYTCAIEENIYPTTKINR